MGCSTSMPMPDAPRREISSSSQHGSYLDYNLGLKIGKGSYAQVHRATPTRRTNRSSLTGEVAIKIRYLHDQKQLQRGDKDKVLKSAFNEVAVWKQIGYHENCVRLLDSFFDDHLTYMVMEKCAGSLFQYLRGLQTVSERSFAIAFRQLLRGLDHMHARGVIHRDIKPDNFLVGGRNGNVAKLCDFGLSTTMPDCGYLNGILGTAPYMPPEMLVLQTYDLKADVWSFGAVAYLMLCGSFPYDTPDGTSKGMKMAILKGPHTDCRRAYLSKQGSEFLEEFLQRDPRKRPSANMALFLPYLKTADSMGKPCLFQILEAAQKTGAFDSHELTYRTAVDETLENMRTGVIGESKSRSFTVENVNDVVSQLKAAKNFLSAEANSGDDFGASTTCGSTLSPSPSPFSSESIKYTLQKNSAGSHVRNDL